MQRLWPSHASAPDGLKPPPVTSSFDGKMTNRTLDFGQIREIAHKGVRRSAAFLGLGVNASRDPEFKKYQLSDLTIFRVIPEGISDADVSHLKEEFEKWVVVNGLRELVESFAIFLDRIHTACLLMATSKNAIRDKDANTYGIAFERKGVEQKLSVMRNRFGVGTEKETYLASINQARNCITHRNGRVGLEDAGEDNVFRLNWWALDLYVETPTGETHLLTPPYPKEGIFLKGGGIVMMKITDRVREYSLGQYVRLSPNDLSEICLLFQLSTDEVVKSAIEYAEGIGIEVRKTQDSVEQEAPADS